MLERNCRRDSGNLPICVAIRTYFRAETLAKVLDSILALNYPKELIEIILAVDSHDTGALKVVEEFKAKGLRLEAIILDVNSATRGWNLGIVSCNSEIVMVLPDDIILHPEVINTALRYLNNIKVVAIGFPAISISPSLGEKLHHWRFIGSKTVEASTIPPVVFFKKSMLMKMGLYREDMGPPLTIHEDWELGSRIRRHGYKVLISGELKMLHIEEHVSSKKDDNIAIARHRWSALTHKFVSYIKHLVHYSKAYVNKHWWSFFQVLKVSPSSQKLEYVAYYAIPLTAILLLAVNTFWFLTFLLAVLALIEVHSLARGYYRVLSVRERLAYPVILVLARIFRSYLALAGLLYNVTIRGLAYRARR